MTRENVRDKARRYLTEARLLLTEVKPGYVKAVARGDGALYHLGWEAGEWWCTCPARGRCCHLVALGHVVVPDLAGRHTP